MSKALRSLSLPGSTLEADAFSLSYPACPTSDNQKKPVLLNEYHFAPVFTPSILEQLYLSAGNSTHLHNLMTQAVDKAPSCKGQYPVVIFAPTAGGQRQAYTQAASELASLGHVVLTVDYPYLSGAMEGQLDQGVRVSTFGDWIHTDEALLIQKHDLQLVYSRVVNESQPLSGLPSWTNDTTVQLNACIFGHGSGGHVAQKMVESHAIKCGGPLEGILVLPAPFNNEETANNPPSSVRPSSVRPSSVQPSSAHGISQIPPLDLSPPTMGGLIQFLVHLRDQALETFGLLVCALKGTCGHHGPLNMPPVQKRSVGDDPWYYPQIPYPKVPCYDGDYGYEDDKYGHDSDCYDDKWDGDYDGHYEDDYDYDDPCEYRDPYDPCDRYDRPYRPSKPFPPPGIFPPNMTWPPYGDGKLPPGYDQPWDDHWDDYHNHGGDYGQGGDYGRKYGHKDCDYYDGGYDEGYEGDYDDDYHCDHYPDHYRIWDMKHHCHGHVDDHDDDDYYDHDDDDYDDDYDGHDDDDYDNDCGDGDYDDCDEHEDDYDEDDHHGDCHENHHDHGHVDDHHDAEHEDDYSDDYNKDDDYDHDHGHVDDWDNEDHAFKM